LKYHEFARGTVYDRPQNFSWIIRMILFISIRIYLKITEFFKRYTIWAILYDKIDCQQHCYFSEDAYLFVGAQGRIIAGNNFICRGIIHCCNNAVVRIGDNVHIGDNSILYAQKDIEIGNNVQIATDVLIFDSNIHSLNANERTIDFQKIVGQLQKNIVIDENQEVVKSKFTKIEDDVWIGAHCIILKGVVIGRGAVIAAGSIITKDVSPYTLVANPTAEYKKTLSTK